MSRPKSKSKKGRTAPMSAHTNGDGRPTGIPPDVVWDDENPPRIYACSQHTDHEDSCDGSCESEVCTHSMVDLMNEARAWAREGMNFMGLPTVLANGPFNGIQVEVFDVQCRGVALQNILIEKGLITLEEIDEEFRNVKIGIMRRIRLEVADQLHEARQRAALGVPKKKLLGPHGEIL